MIVQKNMKKFNVTHPSDVSASRCRGSLVLATADRNRRLPLCWRAPSCRQKYRKTWRNVTRPIPPTCLPHGVAAACFVLATADKKAETHNHLSIHQWVRSAIFAPQQHASPIGFLFLKLPPPPCAVLLVFHSNLWLTPRIHCRKKPTDHHRGMDPVLTMFTWRIPW